jgi:hypothetical protein
VSARPAWLLLLLVVFGCPKRGDQKDREVRELLEQADAAWENRGQLGLEEASLSLLAAWGVDPQHIGVAWRLARQKVAEGIVAEDPNAARTLYAEARALAIGCLDRDVAFAQDRASSGWEVALENVPIARERCAAWGALAWARWMSVTGGAATAIDLDAVQSLVAATTATEDELTNDIGTWAGGVLAAVRPTWSGGSADDARTALEAAIDRAPEDLVRRADLYTLVLEPTDDPDAATVRAEILAATPKTPEDAAVQKQLSGTQEGDEASAAKGEARPADE